MTEGCTVAGLVDSSTASDHTAPAEWARVVQPAPRPRALREVVAVAGRVPAGAGGWVLEVGEVRTVEIRR